LFQELTGEFMTKELTIDKIRTSIEPLARKYKVNAVYLFGSYARGDYTDESDIDLRIDKGELKGYFALCGLYTELKEMLGVDVDVLTTGALDDEFLSSIRDEEVLLYAKK